MNRRRGVETVQRCCQNQISLHNLGSVWRKSAYRPGGNRHIGGMNLYLASLWNMGTCRSDVKGEIQAARIVRVRVPMQSTGADQPVVVMKPGNAGGAKGLNCSVWKWSQP